MIADNVGDNVGDCAGMAADLFETYAVTIVATMLLGGLLLAKPDDRRCNAARLSAGARRASRSSPRSSARFFVKARDGGKIMNALYSGLIVSGVLAPIAFYFITQTDG